MVQTHVFPQNGDNNDAEHFGQLVSHPLLDDQVITGCGFTYDGAVPEVTVAQGVVSINVGTQTAPSTGEDVLAVAITVQLPQQTVALTDSATNHVYVEPDTATQDNASVQAYTSTGTAPANALKIGEIDTSADSVTELNRVPSLNTLSIGSGLDMPDDVPIQWGDDNDIDLEYVSSSDVLDIDGGAGLRLSNGDFDINTNDIVDGGTTIWSGTDGHLNGSAIETDGIGTDEIDLSVTPTWTGSHTFQSDVDVQNTSGSETVGVPVYSTSSDLPAGSEGDIAYVQDENQLYVFK